MSETADKPNNYKDAESNSLEQDDKKAIEETEVMKLLQELNSPIFDWSDFTMSETANESNNYKKAESSNFQLEDTKASEQTEVMELLHELNELKDAAQKIIGAIAHIEGKTIKQIHLDLKLPLDS